MARIVFCLWLALLLPWPASAQVTGLHLLGTGELALPTPQQINKTPPAAPVRPMPAASAIGIFRLRQVVITGSPSVPAAQLAAAWAPAIGHDIDGADLQNIGQRIGMQEAAAGIVLYSVNIESIRQGMVVLRVTEGSVVHVVITGDTQGQRLGLVEAYANNILRCRPLRREVLERNILLIGDIAGAKIGSRFIPVNGGPASVELILTVRQITLFGGFDVNNQGTPLLDNTQGVLNAGVNNLFHQGERTQFLLGVPLDITRYQYYGINDTEPLGGNGWSASFSGGELVSNPVGQSESGAAQLFDVQVNDPVIRAVHRNLNLSLGFGYLNSSNALLGSTLSDERTRALRLSVIYNDDKYYAGINNAGATFSQGIGVLGARRAGFAYGEPEFTKGNFNVQRLQALPFGFALRLTAIGQFTADRLPPSEEFQYGGPDFGQAFYAAALSGDEGIAGLGEVGHALPAAVLPKPLAGTSLFVETDYGRIWNRNTIYAPATDRGASFAFGIKFLLVQKISLELGAATPIIKPKFAGSDQHWRFIVATSGQF